MQRTTVILDAKGETQKATELFHHLSVDDAEKIVIEQAESVHANLTIFYKNGDVIRIINGFELGYHGEGSIALHDILEKDLHMSTETCEQVFKPQTHRMVLVI